MLPDNNDVGQTNWIYVFKLFLSSNAGELYMWFMSLSDHKYIYY